MTLLAQRLETRKGDNSDFKRKVPAVCKQDGKMLNLKQFDFPLSISSGTWYFWTSDGHGVCPCTSCPTPGVIPQIFCRLEL